MPTPRQLQDHYARGENICALLREEKGLDHNTQDIVEVAYDLQTGSYIEGMASEEAARLKKHFTREIARTIAELCSPASVLEAGVGEATTLSGVLQQLPHPVISHGFDISWSRVAFARRWLLGQGLADTGLCTGNLLDIPYADNSIDVVFTSHAVEPNRGHEERILRELYRVTRRYLVLLEPGYELADEKARLRMDHHGYCRNLPGTAEELGLQVMRHALFPHVVNPLNPTALTIIRKEHPEPAPTEVLACPKYKTPLERIGHMLFSAEALLAYPIMGGIPCLRIENGILAGKFKEVMAGG